MSADVRTGGLLDVRASRASLRRAQAALRRAERRVLTAERRVLLRAAKNVRSMETALLAGRTSVASPRVPRLDRAWRRLLHPGARMGGVLAQKSSWRIDAPGPHSRVVDVVPGLSPLLERWQGGGGDRPARLRQWVSDLRDSREGRHLYHSRVAPARPTWPRDPALLPAVGAQPLRPVVAPVERYARAHMAEWYAKIWDTMQRRG